MKILAKDFLFRGYADLLLLCVYDDRISALVARTDKEAMRIVAHAEEPIEGSILENGTINKEKIIFNCRKALAGLPPEHRATARHCAIIFGGAAGTFNFSFKEKTRADQDAKIGEEEMKEMISGGIAENFTVNGFSVEDPLGMEGKEIKIGVISMAIDENLSAQLTELVRESGLVLEGYVDARLALARNRSILTPDSVIVLIFKEETSIIVKRNGLLCAFAKIPSGYGIINDKAAHSFFVGEEEGKNLIKLLRAGKLSEDAAQKAVAAVKEGSVKIKNLIAGALAMVDKSNILPQNMFFYAPDIPELKNELSDKSWLADLPIERNTEIKFVDDSAFETIVLNYMS